MASSKLLSSSSTSHSSDLRRKSSSSSSPSSHISFDSTLPDAQISLLDAAGAITPFTAPKKTVDDVWNEIVAGKREIKECKTEAIMDENHDTMLMTLEDFLAKAEEEEEEEEDVKVVGTERLSGGLVGFDSGPIMVGYGNGVGGRVKRRSGAVVLEPLDKAAQQRQRRMIKNRESAARSRERKQAYQVELESMAVKLEEENERLLKEKAEWTKERFKQLMEKVVPVVEKRKPARTLRRVCSMEW